MIDWSFPVFDKPPYFPGDRVFMIMDGHFAMVDGCKMGKDQWHCYLKVDGKAIGSRPANELAKVKLRVVRD